ncbi:hypothetical protein D3C81_71400 [compost metagenome]
MNVKIFIAKDKKQYELRDEDDGGEISVYLDGVRMGEIYLRSIEVDAPEYVVYLITGLNLEKCKHNGLGRACLQYHRELYDSTILAGSETGTTSDDGSHLTGDGPGFIERMRADKIVS